MRNYNYLLFHIFFVFSIVDGKASKFDEESHQLRLRDSSIDFQLFDTTDAEVSELRKRFVQFNQQVCPFTQQPAYIPHKYVIKDINTNTTIAGLLADQSCWDYMEISLLYVDETHKGQGLEKRLMNHLERQALMRSSAGKVHITLTVFDWQDPKFYKSLGYKDVGKVKNIPSKGHTFYFLYKKLKVSAEEFEELRKELAAFQEPCVIRPAILKAFKGRRQDTNRLQVRRKRSRSANSPPRLFGINEERPVMPALMRERDAEVAMTPSRRINSAEIESPNSKNNPSFFLKDQNNSKVAERSPQDKQKEKPLRRKNLGIIYPEKVEGRNAVSVSTPTIRRTRPTVPPLVLPLVPHSSPQSQLLMPLNKKDTPVENSAQSGKSTPSVEDVD